MTPIQVTLDGKEHTVPLYPMSDIAYTVDDGSDPELQTVASATPFLNPTQWGYLNIPDVRVSLLTADPAHVDPDLLAGDQVDADMRELVSANCRYPTMS